MSWHAGSCSKILLTTFHSRLANKKSLHKRYVMKKKVDLTFNFFTSEFVTQVLDKSWWLDTYTGAGWFSISAGTLQLNNCRLIGCRYRYTSLYFMKESQKQEFSLEPSTECCRENPRSFDMMIMSGAKLYYTSSLGSNWEKMIIFWDQSQINWDKLDPLIVPL